MLTSIIAVSEELDDVFMANMHENLKLLLEGAVEPLAASVHLDCYGVVDGGAWEEAQIDRAKPTFTNDPRKVPSHSLNLLPLESPHQAFYFI